MKESADKHLDDLSRKVIGKSTTESLSFDFTNTVMSQIKALNTSKATTYVPLISKRVWSILAIVFIGVLGYLVLGSSNVNSGWLSQIGIDRFLNYEFSNSIVSLDLSQTVIYAILLFGIMLCIQIPLLKHYFNTRTNG